MFKAVLVSAVVAAGIACAPLAQADGNDQYDQFLISHGAFRDVLPNGNSPLAQGQQTCAALRAGKSESFLIGQLESQMDRATAEDIVVAAHRYLCPGA